MEIQNTKLPKEKAGEFYSALKELRAYERKPAGIYGGDPVEVLRVLRNACAPA